MQRSSFHRLSFYKATLVFILLDENVPEDLLSGWPLITSIPDAISQSVSSAL